MYLLIENQGVCPLEGFTILGLSASRSKDEKIGEFGSGNKHAVNVLLRHGLSPRIYLGTQKLEFSTEEDIFEGESYHRVLYRLGNKKPVETGFCLEFGVRDWKNTFMALREIVSNAIDRAGADNINFEVTDKMRARSGYTRIYIPYSDDVKNFHENIKQFFLQFTGTEKTNLIKKNTATPARIYRKGVFVREVSADQGPSLFDYNFGNEFTIDEARNASDNAIVSSVSTELTNSKEALITVFRAIKDNKTYFWEFKLSEWNLKFSSYKSTMWQEAWEIVFGNTAITRDQYVHEMAKQRGWASFLFDSPWTSAILYHGIKDTASRFSEVESKGYAIIEPTLDALNNLDLVWKWMEELVITNGKEKPALHCFSGASVGNEVLFGYYQNDAVYINVDHDDNLQTMIEEVAHHITGSTDLSRDFQEFAFQVAAKLMQKIGITV